MESGNLELGIDTGSMVEMWLKFVVGEPRVTVRMPLPLLNVEEEVESIGDALPKPWCSMTPRMMTA